MEKANVAPMLKDGVINAVADLLKNRHLSAVAKGEAVSILGYMLDDEDCLIVTLQDGQEDGSFIAEILLKNSFRLKMLKEEEIDLEDVFMSITKGITN